MAKLGSRAKSRKLRPVEGMAGVYLRPLKVRKLRKLEDMPEDVIEQILVIGEVICDEKGEPFEDMVSVWAIEASDIDVELIAELFDKVIVTINQIRESQEKKD